MKKYSSIKNNLKECYEELSSKANVDIKTIKKYAKIEKHGKSFLFGIFKTNFFVTYSSFDEKKDESEEYRISEALKTLEEYDGFFTIDYKDKSAFLTIFPPSQKGNTVDPSDIIKRLRLLKVNNIAEKLIRDSVEQKKEIKIRVGDWESGGNLDNYFKIEISPDKLYVYCTLLPPKYDGLIITEENILQALNVRDIKTNIIKIEELKKYIKKGNYNQQFIVAQGKPAINGKNAYLKYYFNYKKTINLEENADGSVNFKNLNIIETVNKDSLLCSKIEPTLGENGIDVFGNVLRSIPGKDITIKNGKNTFLDAKSQNVYSSISGEPIINDAGEVAVNEICKIDGDVNYSTGNIDFIGTVIIDGRVEDNFKIKAGGDILIKSNVGSKVTLEAVGNIIIDGGVLGKNETLIKSKKNVIAKFIESAIIYAGENIVCSKIIMHSTITAGNQIRVVGDRGALIGGDTKVGESLIVNELGAIGAAITTVQIGVEPEIILQIANLESEKTEVIKKADKVKIGIETLKKRAITTNLTETENKQILQLNTMFNNLSKKIESIKSEIKNLKSSTELNPRAKIQVRDKLFANVHIKFGQIQRNFSKEEIHVRLGLMDNKIAILPYD